MLFKNNLYTKELEEKLRKNEEQLLETKHKNILLEAELKTSKVLSDQLTTVNNNLQIEGDRLREMLMNAGQEIMEHKQIADNLKEFIKDKGYMN